MASAAFERFRSSFFEDNNSARDGLAIPALSQLQGEEAAQAEAMLIGPLPDTRAVIGLGILRSRRAEPELTRMFEAEQRARRKATGDEPWPTDQLVYLAKSLWRIRPDRRWLDAIRQRSGLRRRLAATDGGGRAPRRRRSRCRTGADQDALDDSEPLVRHHAARGLLEMHGLSTDSLDPTHMMYRVMSDDAARRERGKQDILAAIDGRPIGEPWSVRGF